MSMSVTMVSVPIPVASISLYRYCMSLIYITPMTPSRVSLPTIFDRTCSQSLDIKHGISKP
jgi:hypothetical protein